MEEQIITLINKEVEKRVNERVTKFIEYVSRTYDVSHQLLTRDFQNGVESCEAVPPEDMCQPCKGLTAKGKRCFFSGKFNGYCKKHRPLESQRPHVVKRVESENAIRHTHSIPPLFQEGCPACQRNTNLQRESSSKNLLIEM